MAEGSSATQGRPSLAWNDKPGSGQRPVPDGCRHGYLGSPLPVGLGSRWRGRLPPARTTPASSPTVRPTVRAVVRSRAKAAAGDSPSRSISTPLACSIRTRWPSAHCSCSASSPLTVAVATARNKLATTPA
jgi:hypothetical protein